MTPKNEIHACQPLPDGVVLIAESGPCRLIEVNRKGEILHEVKLTTNCKRTHGQMRAARKLANGNTVICNWGGHGHVGQQPQIVEVTRDKKVVATLFDNQRFKTISGICVLGEPGDATRFGLLR